MFTPVSHVHSLESMNVRRAPVIVSLFAGFFALFVVGSVVPARAQMGAGIGDAPVAGSGKLPSMNPFAAAPQNVVEAVRKLLENHRDNEPFQDVKRCFRRVGNDPTSLIGCRNGLNRYFELVTTRRRDLLGPLPKLEVYTRLVQLSGDPEAEEFTTEVYSLRGLLITVDEAQRFHDIRNCFDDAGPQPVMRQVCRQRLQTFDIELRNAHSILFRDLDPKLIRKRLFQVADTNGALFGYGETTPFESLRKIRERDQQKRAEALRLIAAARGRYCPAPRGRLRDPLEDVMSGGGVCLCTYGRRYVGTRASADGDMAIAAYGRCGDSTRFRIVDLNGGYLMSGDWVAIRTAGGSYLSVHGDSYVFADKSTVGRYERFRVVRATGLAGRILAGEMVTLISARGGYVIPNFNGGARLRTTINRPEAYDYFVFSP